MARSYKRDKLGRFASTGGGGGSKPLSGNRSWKRSGPTPGTARTPGAYAGRGQTAADSKRQNRELANNAKYSAKRGKTALRQSVQAKRTVEATKQASVRSTKYGGPKPFADQRTASRSINRSMSKAANARISATSVSMSKSASKSLGAKWQKDAATLKANKARRLGKK